VAEEGEGVQSSLIAGDSGECAIDSEKMQELVSEFTGRFRGGKEFNEMLKRDCRAMLEAAMKSEDAAMKPFTMPTLFAKNRIFFNNEKRTIFTSRYRFWSEVRADTGLDIPRTTFLSRTKAIRKARTRSDLCPICMRGSYLLTVQRILQRQGKPLPADKARTLDAYRQHLIGNEIQREALLRSIARVTHKRVTILMDFKQDWALTLTKSEPGTKFFNPNQVAHLGFVVITRATETTVRYEYFHFLQNPSKKDAVMVAECFAQFRTAPELDVVRNAERLDFFADCGSHFQNRCVLFHLLSVHGSFPDKQVSITFFAEHHGKSVCDSGFGYLTRHVSDNLTDDQIDKLSKFYSFLQRLRTDGRGEGGKSTISRNHHFLMYVCICMFHVFMCI
jgi:hypothetical protein